MNYIRHLNAFFSFVRSDERLACSHVSLYLALFQYWNFNRFQNPFPIYRENIMQLSKIGSKNTYHKCVKELHQAGYIIYKPPATKFQAVKISMIRLDIKEEELKSYKQLDLFASLPLKGGDLEGGFSTEIDTDSVPNLTGTSTEIDTVSVSKVGHSLKHKHFKNESKTRSQKIFSKNKKIGGAINAMGGVPKSVHSIEQVVIVNLGEVEKFFAEQNYPADEARKFFNHYTAIGWKIKGITPIKDWQAAAHKWMMNVPNFENKSHPQPAPAVTNDLEGIYQLFLSGKAFFHLLTTDHFDELNLQLTKELLEYARQQRINQLTGSNQNSILQLLFAYQDNKENDRLMIKDKDNLLLLAKRIAIVTYFTDLKENNYSTLKPTDHEH